MRLGGIRQPDARLGLEMPPSCNAAAAVAAAAAEVAPSQPPHLASLPAFCLPACPPPSPACLLACLLLCADSEEDDPELLLHVPFGGAVKLTGITVIGGPEGTSPAKMRVFINREDLDFAAVADLPPVQEWELLENHGGQIEYPTQ